MFWKIFGKFLDVLGIAILLAIIILGWKLYQGPISLPVLKPYIENALSSQSGKYDLSIGEVELSLQKSIQPLKIIAKDFSYNNNEDGLVITAPKTEFAFSIKAFLSGIVAPRSIVIHNPDVSLFLNYGVAQIEKQEDKYAALNKKKVEYFFNYFGDFLTRYNDEDKIFTESFINNIEIVDGRFEVHEVDLGKKWVLENLTYKFDRNLTDIETQLLLNLKNKNNDIVPIDISAKYGFLSKKINFNTKIENFNPSAIADNLQKGKVESYLSNIEAPITFDINSVINFEALIKNRKEILTSLDKVIETIDIDLTTENGSLYIPDPVKERYSVYSIKAKAKIKNGLDNLSLSNAVIDLGGKTATVKAEVNGLEKLLLDNDASEFDTYIETTLDQINFSELPKFWPKNIGSAAWGWCKSSLVGGFAKDINFRFDFAWDENKQAVIFKGLDGTVHISDADIDYLTGMPVISKANGVAKFSEKDIKIKIHDAVSSNIDIKNGHVELLELSTNPYIDISMKGDGEIQEVLGLIDNEPFNFMKEFGIDPSKFGGIADNIDLNIKFPIKSNLKGKDIDIKLSSELASVSIADAYNNISVNNGDLDLKLDNQGLKIFGKADFGVLPIDFKWNQYFSDKKKKTELDVKFKFKDEMLKSFDLKKYDIILSFLEGSIDVSSNITIFNDGAGIVGFRADLLDAKADASIIDFVKPIGEPASATASVRLLNSSIKEISNLMIDSDKLKLSGKITLKDKLIDVKLNQIETEKTKAKAAIKIHDGKNKKVEINVSGRSYSIYNIIEENKKVKLKDPSIKKEELDLSNLVTVDLNFAVDKLWTTKKDYLNNVNGEIDVVEGKGLNKININGNLGDDINKIIKVEYTPRDNGEYILLAESNDAGLALKALGLYENMYGGYLKINGKQNLDKTLIGHAKIRNFNIKNTPLLANLLTVGSFTGILDLLSGSGIAFENLDAPFKYKNKIMYLNEAQASGNVMGINGSGFYDSQTKDIEIEGVFVPVHGLNKLIGNIPVIGNLLAGKDGTVFATNYNISGKATDPKIEFNALSTLSPNSIKEIFSDTSRP